MARTREVKTISLDPANPDAAEVLTALETCPRGTHSAAILRWAAAYLRGESAQLAAATTDEDTDLDIALDNL